MNKSNKRKLAKYKLIVRIVAGNASKLIAYQARERVFGMFPWESTMHLIASNQQLKAIAATPAKHFRADGSGKIDKRRVKRFNKFNKEATGRICKSYELCNTLININNKRVNNDV